MSGAGIGGLGGYLINLSSFRRSEHMLFLTPSKQLCLRRRPPCATACAERFTQPPPPPQRCRDKTHEPGKKKKKTAGRSRGRRWSKWERGVGGGTCLSEKSAVLWVIYYFFFSPINVPFVSLNTQGDVEMKGWWMTLDEWWMRRGGGGGGWDQPRRGWQAELFDGGRQSDDTCYLGHRVLGKYPGILIKIV